MVHILSPALLFLSNNCPCCCWSSILHRSWPLPLPIFAAHSRSLPLSVAIFLFSIPLPPPLSPLYLPPHNPLTSFINVSVFAPFSSCLMSSVTLFTCFSLISCFTFLSFAFLSQALTASHTFLFCIALSCSYLSSCLLPGGLAVEYHHHRQLHEQVQPPVFIPAAAQTHGVEPAGCLVSSQEDRWGDGSWFSPQLGLQPTYEEEVIRFSVLCLSWLLNINCGKCTFLIFF